MRTPPRRDGSSRLHTHGGSCPQGVPALSGLRVLLVAPGHARRGGTRVQGDVLARILDVAGARVRLAAFPFGHEPARSACESASRFRSDVLAALRDGVDVVHVHGGHALHDARAAAFAVREAALRRVRVVVRWDGVGGLVGTARDVLRLRRIVDRADRVVVPSGWHAAEVERVLRVRPRVIPDVIEGRERVPPLRRTSGDRTDPLRLLCTRAHRPERGIDAVVRAAAEAQRAGVTLRLLVAGDGPETDRLRASAHRELGDAVTFLGRVSRDRVMELLDTTDVVVNGSREDDQPHALAEAMACGVPVVTTAAGGIPWLVRDGREGFVVPVGAERPMARALARLHWDRRLLDQLGRQAADRASGWTWDAVRPAWVDAWGAADAVRGSNTTQAGCMRGGK